MDATDKPFNIDKKLVYEAYKAVKSNAGAAGVDGQTIEQFEADLTGNLYKIWNRMSSGSYFPPPVRAVSIPKKSGGQRILGVPTVADRVAQMVVKQLIEPDLEPIFLADSYGYRPSKSALDAVGVTRKRCWKYDWVLEFDIKGLFDNIDHDTFATGRSETCDVQMGAAVHRKMADGADGTWRMARRIERTRGTPQGGVVSPCWPICSCTTRLISGWHGHTQTSRGVGMRTMGWCTVGASRRRRPSRPSFRHGWRSAVWRCIRRKPRSSTARTGSAKASIRTSSLTSSDIGFRPRLVKNSETRQLCSGASTRRSAPRR